MGDLVNLRLMKKRREKAAKAQDAEGKRRLFGQTKAEKQALEAVRRKAEAVLDQARLEPPESND